MKDNRLSYYWQGFNQAGVKIGGEIRAQSLVNARVSLLKQGIIIKKISKKPDKRFGSKNKKIKSTDIVFFSQQMATLFEAGIPLIQAFDLISKEQTKEIMKYLIDTIKKEVESGLSFAEALRKHPLYFNDLFCNMVDAGEKSGSLDIMLKKLAAYKEKIETIKKKIKKALTYPAAVFVLAGLVTVCLLIFVVPQFESLFKDFGADLPLLTRAVITLSKFFQSYSYFIFGIIFAGIYTFKHLHKTSPQFAQAIEIYLLKIPWLGSLMKKAIIARFSRTLSITFTAGLPLVAALQAAAGTTGSVLYAQGAEKIRQEVATGLQMQTAMRKTNLFPQMVIQMVAIGEESGSLEQMLDKVADFYEEEVDTIVDSLSALLEPLIMAILGLFVGGLVVAMYLPIFKLGSVF